MENDKKGIGTVYTRKRLADMLPLDTPLAIDFHPTTYCNIKCIFCFHSSENQYYDSIKNKMMSLELFKKSIDDIKKFPQKIKSIHFCGLGEPLINKDLAEMISYAKLSNVAEKMDIVTNGILLNQKKSNEILASDIDFIRISVNGLCDEDFFKYTGSKINFEEYLNNLKYLYKNRGTTKIYIKTFSFMVDSLEKKDFFHNTFSPICDYIDIEHYNECFEDTKGKEELHNANLSQRGENLGGVQVCSQPFFKMEIHPDGFIAPCAASPHPILIGNIKDSSLVDLWNSKKLNNFHTEMLNGVSNANKICRECSFIKVCSFNSDSLDEDKDRLKLIYATPPQNMSIKK